MSISSVVVVVVALSAATKLPSFIIEAKCGLCWAMNSGNENERIKKNENNNKNQNGEEEPKEMRSAPAQNRNRNNETNTKIFWLQEVIELVTKN